MLKAFIIYYDRNKGTLKEYWWNRYDQEGGKEKQNNIIKITKKDYKDKHQIDIENFLMKKEI